MCESVDNNNTCAYGVCAFCWYIKDKIAVRKMHGMEIFKIIGAQQAISVNKYFCLHVSMFCSALQQSHCLSKRSTNREI